jgi:MFS family permease
MLAAKLTQNRMIQAVCVCFAASLFFAYELMQLHMLNAITPMLMADLQFSATDLGILGSTYILADVLFLLPAGIILDRFSVRKVVLFALGLCILGTVGFAWANTLFEACVCHFFSGIGNAFCFLSCMMLCSRWFPARSHALVMGLMVTMGLLGGVVAQTPFSLLAQAFNWRDALLVDAAIGLFVFIIIYLFVVDARKEKEINVNAVPFWNGIKLSIMNRQNVMCAVYTGMMNLPIMLLGAMWGSLFLMQVHEMKMTEATLVTSMLCLGTIIGSPLVGFISDKMGTKKPTMVAGTLASLALFAVIAVTNESNPVFFAFLFFCLGVSTSTQVLGYPLIAENNPPELTGTSMGIAGMVIMGSALVLQPISGMLIDYGWNGHLVDGVRFYTQLDFLRAFIIFPIGFVISYFCARLISEKRQQRVEKVTSYG